MNSEFQTNQIKKFNIFFINFLIICGLFSVSIAFMVITYVNSNFKWYSENFDAINHELSKNYLENPFYIYFFEWLAFSLLLISLFILFINSKLFNKKTISKIKKNYLNIGFLFCLILSAICFSISEYYYSKFQELYILISQKDFLSLFKSNIFAQAHDVFSKDALNNYEWTSTTSTWWLLCIRLTIIMILFTFIQNKIASPEKTARNVFINSRNFIKKSSVGKKGIFKILNNFSISNEKSLSLWTLFVSFLIILPQFIYAIRLSNSNDSLNILLDWTIVVPELIPTEYIIDTPIEEIAKIDRLNGFVIFEFPVLCVVLCMSFSVVLLITYVIGYKVNFRAFYTQILVLIFLLLLSTIANAISLQEVNNIQEEFNEKNINKIFLNTESSKYKFIYDIFGTIDLVSGEIKNLWLEGNEYIAQILISIVFGITCYSIIGHKVSIIGKNRKDLKINKNEKVK